MRLQLPPHERPDLGRVAAELAEQALRPAEGLEPSLEVPGGPLLTKGLEGNRGDDAQEVAAAMLQLGHQHLEPGVKLRKAAE
jgi:hypothetical protein